MTPGMNVIAVPPGDVVVSKCHWLWDVGELLVVFSTRVVVIRGNIPVIGHTAKVNFVAIVERSIERLASVVPLTCTPGSVASVA